MQTIEMIVIGSLPIISVFSINGIEFKVLKEKLTN